MGSPGGDGAGPVPGRVPTQRASSRQSPMLVDAITSQSLSCEHGSRDGARCLGPSSESGNARLSRATTTNMTPMDDVLTLLLLSLASLPPTVTPSSLLALPRTAAMRHLATTLAFRPSGYSRACFRPTYLPTSTTRRALSSTPTALAPSPPQQQHPIYRRFPRAGEQPKPGLTPFQQRILDIEPAPGASPRPSSSPRGGGPGGGGGGRGGGGGGEQGAFAAFWSALDGRKKLVVLGLVGASGYYVYQCVCNLLPLGLNSVGTGV